MMQPLIEDPKIIEQFVEQISQQEHLNRRGVNVLNAETHKQMLGPFYKRGVEFVQNYGGIDMAMEVFVTDIDKKEENYWTNATQERPLNRVFIGVSGAGKTYSLLRTCRKTYTLYNTAAQIYQEVDRYVDCLKTELERLKKVVFKTCTDRNNAGISVIIRWITVKWMCLLHLLDYYEDYTPSEFLYSQLGGQSMYYKECYDACRRLLTFENQDYLQQCEAWKSIHRSVIQQISKKTGISTGFGFAFDEAQVLYELFTDLYVTLY
jgi:hypothetical protein